MFAHVAKKNEFLYVLSLFFRSHISKMGSFMRQDSVALSPMDVRNVVYKGKETWIYLYILPLQYPLGQVLCLLVVFSLLFFSCFSSLLILSRSYKNNSFADNEVNSKV
jgi:hypothetical protein